MFKYLIHLGIGYSVLVFLYYIGKILFQIFKMDSETLFKFRSFFYLVLGYIFISICSAIFVTKGESVFIVSFLVSVIYILFNKEAGSKFKFNLLEDKTQFLHLTILFLILYSISFVRYFSIDLNDFFIVAEDPIFYGRIAHNIFKTGIENNFGLNDYFIIKGATPYHYSELWFTGFFSNIFGINQIVFHLLLTYTIGTLIIVYGLFLSMLKLPIISRYLIALVAIFISGSSIITDILERKVYFIENSVIWISSIHSITKLFPIYIFILAFVILLKTKQNLIKAFWILSFLPCVYFTTIPFVFLFTITYAIYVKFITKKSINFILFPLFSIIGCFLFYKIWGTDFTNHVNQKNNFTFLLGNNFNGTLKSVVFHVFSNTIEVSLTYIFYLPLFLMFYIKIQKNKFENWIYGMFSSLLITLGCLFFITGVLFFMADSWQLLSNITIPIINLTIVYIVYYFVVNKYFEKLYINICVSLYGLYMIFNIYSFKKNEYTITKISSFQKQLIENKKLLNSGLMLYYGNYKVNQIDMFKSLLINGLYCPVNYLAVYNIDIWTVNVKLPNILHENIQYYPYCLINGSKTINNINEKMLLKSGKFILVDKALKTDLPRSFHSKDIILY